MCRHLREPGLFFGNLQVICVGDFYQLRPVPDDLHNDPGHYVFTSPVWQSTITHKITLTQVLRQGDAKLITAVDELARGVPGDETN